jgi:hypothetical protein
MALLDPLLSPIRPLKLFELVPRCLAQRLEERSRSGRRLRLVSLSPGHREIAKRVGGVARPIVTRLVPKNLRPLIEVRSVLPICITNYGKSPIQAYTDIVLYTAAKETRFPNEAMTSRIAETAIVDALHACMALANYDRALDMIQRTGDIISTKRF